jgi:copper chaperone CopZ
MTHTYKVSGMTCSGCASTVEKALRQVAGVIEAKVNLSQSEVELTMQQPVATNILQAGLANYPSYQLSEDGDEVTNPIISKDNFWQDKKIWNRASLNTLNCLIGCSIGDFGMIIFLQAFYPSTSMIMQTILATIAGLMTSVLLETILLRSRERFSWKFAFQTAVSMSFLSMVAMELAMNATDFMITGGKASFNNPMYWTALIIALVAGFLAPLPYNYYKLKKYNKACH